jgi:hypothetical protein
MDADFAYWNKIIALRSQEGDEEDWLSATRLLSAETMPEDLGEDHLSMYVKGHFNNFLKYLHYLNDEDRDLLLSYFCLGTSQKTIGKILNRTQTSCSYRWRAAAKNLGFIIMSEGLPSKQIMETTLIKAGQDPMVADFVVRYRASGNLHQVWLNMRDRLPGTRPTIIRKMIYQTSAAMVDNEDGAIAGMGAYLFGLMDSKDPTGALASKASKKRLSEIIRKDPDCFGQFRIKPSDVGKLFISKSSIHYALEEETNE